MGRWPSGLRQRIANPLFVSSNLILPSIFFERIERRIEGTLYGILPDLVADLVSEEFLLG